MNRLLFIVFAFIIFAQPLFPQESLEDNMYIKRMREQYERRQKQQNNFQKPMDDSVLTLLGRWAWGACGCVDIHLPYAYIGNGSLIQILNISNPETPTIIGEYLTNSGYIDGLVVKNNYLYANAGGYLLILDISNPNEPVLMGSVNAHGWHLAVSDSFAYVTNWGCYLRIVDISNPSNPYLRGSTYFIGDEIPTNLTIQGKTVYANGNQEWGFSMIDVTDPDHPQSHYYEMESSVSDLSAYDTLLLVCTTSDSFIVFSVSNPLQPVRLGYMITAYGDIIESTVHENIVYSTSGGGVYSIDISSPESPVLRDFYTLNNLTHHFGPIHFSEGIIITGVYSGMMLIDAEKPDSLKQISYFPMAETFWKIKIFGNNVFIACGLSGLWILDISDPYHPKEISNVNIGSCAEDLVVDSNYVYVICRNDMTYNDTARGVNIVDISNVQNPIILNRFVGMIKSFNGIPLSNQININKNHLFTTQYILNNDSIMELIDIQAPSNPTSLAVFKNNYMIYDISANDSIIYLGTSKGLRVINYKNNNPVEITSLLNYTGVVACFRKNNTLYIDMWDSLYLVNITNPYIPFIVSGVNRTYGNSANIDIFVDDKYAYWAAEFLGMFNIENQNNPYEIPLQFDFDAHSIAAKDNIVYIITGDKGFLIFRNKLIINIKNNESEINKFISINNYPNPFNSNTRITFTTTKSEKIKLEVFNILGQKVLTILNDYVQKGAHDINLNFTSLSSGVYIVSLKTSVGVFNKKITFIK